MCINQLDIWSQSNFWKRTTTVKLKFPMVHSIFHLEAGNILVGSAFWTWQSSALRTLQKQSRRSRYSPQPARLRSTPVRSRCMWLTSFFPPGEAASSWTTMMWQNRLPPFMFVCPPPFVRTDSSPAVTIQMFSFSLWSVWLVDFYHICFHSSPHIRFLHSSINVSPRRYCHTAHFLFSSCSSR